MFHHFLLQHFFLFLLLCRTYAFILAYLCVCATLQLCHHNTSWQWGGLALLSFILPVVLIIDVYKKIMWFIVLDWFMLIKATLLDLLEFELVIIENQICLLKYLKHSWKRFLRFFHLFVHWSAFLHKYAKSGNIWNLISEISRSGKVWKM